MTPFIEICANLAVSLKQQHIDEEGVTPTRIHIPAATVQRMVSEKGLRGNMTVKELAGMTVVPTHELPVWAVV